MEWKRVPICWRASHFLAVWVPWLVSIRSGCELEEAAGFLALENSAERPSPPHGGALIMGYRAVLPAN